MRNIVNSRSTKIHHLFLATDLHKTFHIITTKRFHLSVFVCVRLWLNRQSFGNFDGGFWTLLLLDLVFLF